jgi:ADP-ribosylation factor protein 1
MKLFEDTITASELLGAKILVFFNKLDLAGKVRADAKKERFLRTQEAILRGRLFHIQYCCAPTGEGLYEGFEWLASAMRAGPPPKSQTPQEPPDKDK